jgi:hypothetical protein
MAAVAITVSTGLVVLDRVADDEAEASGPHSEWTRSELGSMTAKGARHSALLLPAELPPGAEQQEDGGFYLVSNPITEKSRRDAGKVWSTSYSVSALPPASGNVTGYYVYQEWTGSPETIRARCNKNDRPEGVLVRHVGDDRMTVCLGPHPTAASRKYWRTVRFTANLNEVEWLRDGTSDS